MQKEKILIFPSSSIEAIEFATNNKNKYTSIAASSNYFNTNNQFYDYWQYLPYINETNFLQELKDLLKKHKIDKVFTCSAGVWVQLQNFIDTKKINLEIINEFKYKEAEGVSKTFSKYSTILYQNYKEITASNTLSYLEFSSILYYYHQIDGESGDNKFISLCHIAPNIPKGDIVEIGVQNGRSAFALTKLTQKYKIGKVLCIDPWMDDVLQQDSPDVIREIGTGINTDKVFFRFTLNLLLLKESINYLKMTSNEAIKVYKNHHTIKSEEFGETKYKQKISLLHIDGNHDYKYVYDDLYNYLPLVVDYGWIIIDDYFWAFGDGPRKVGDDFLDKHKQNIIRCFYSDSALFIQVKSI